MPAKAPKEGKISLQAEVNGVLKIHREKLLKINSAGEVMIATKRGDTLIKKEQVFAGMRVIPLVISTSTARLGAHPPSSFLSYKEIKKHTLFM